MQARNSYQRFAALKASGDSTMVLAYSSRPTSAEPIDVPNNCCAEGLLLAGARRRQ
jgi:hypothetical protein